MAPPTPSRLIDTSIFIDLLRGHAPARAWLDSLVAGDGAISAVTFAELVAGCAKPEEQQAVEKELSGLPILWLNESLSQVALSLYRQNHLSRGAHFMACVIAATAIANGLTVCTSDINAFSAFNGLAIEQPYSPS